MLTFQVVPSDPTATPQLAAYEGGRKRLLELSFADLENSALGTSSSGAVTPTGGDFDPAQDLHSVMFNRWNYGYAHELSSMLRPVAVRALGRPAAPQGGGCRSGTSRSSCS